MLQENPLHYILLMTKDNLLTELISATPFIFMYVDILYIFVVPILKAIDIASCMIQSRLLASTNQTMLRRHM